MNIYIVMEVKLRELEGRLLLALAAAEQGHYVILGSKSETLKLAKLGKLPQGIIHDKSITPNNKNINNMKLLNRQGYVITSQDEEHGLLSESYAKFAKSRFSVDSLSEVALNFAWGSHDYNYLTKKYKSHCGKVVMTGSPRVDFWREEFDRYFDVQDTSDNKKRNILIVSNFGSALNVNRFWNILDNARKAGYYERTPESEFRQYNNMAFQIRLVGEFVKLVRALSKAFPDTDIVFRPHPIESLDGWKRLIGTYHNIKITREGTVSKWIRNSSVLIHNGCTTALEAAASNIPRIAYRPIQSEYEREIPNMVSCNVFSLEEAVDLTNLVLNNGDIINKEVNDFTNKILSTRFANLDGKFAADKIVKEWENIGSISRLKQESFNTLIMTGLQINMKKQTKKAFSGIYRSIIKADLKKTSGFTTEHKFPDFKESEVKKAISGLQQALDRFHRVKYKRFGPRAFLFYSK